MTYQLRLPATFTLPELEHAVKSGGRFIVFSYTLSPLAVTLSRLSPAIFVPAPDTVSKHATIYNVLSCLFGWWAIPYGPMRTIQSIRQNNRGGIDVTDDIMANITAESLARSEVVLQTTSLLFEKPGASESSSFRRAVRKKLDKNAGVKRLIAGLYLNVPTGVAPYFVVGIEADNYGLAVPVVRAALYTQFYKHVRFEFVDLREPAELNIFLEKQGDIIIG